MHGHGHPHAFTQAQLLVSFKGCMMLNGLTRNKSLGSHASYLYELDRERRKSEKRIKKKKL